MELQGRSCLGRVIPCRIHLQVLEVAAEDQVAETQVVAEDQVDEDQL